MEPQMKLTPRAERVWKRMVQMFGDKLTGMHPRGMPLAMAQVVDRVDDETVINGLSVMNGMKQPPGIEEFQRVMSSTPAVTANPNRMPALTAYVVANCRLTPYQTRHPWTWLGQGNSREKSQNFGIVGVRIPDDPDGTPGFTVDMAVLA
jgi:hypothetical protein